MSIGLDRKLFQPCEIERVVFAAGQPVKSAVAGLDEGEVAVRIRRHDIRAGDRFSRAGTTTLFHTGDALPPGHQKWFGGLGWRDLYFPTGSLQREFAWHEGPVSLPVGTTTPNAWGRHDMHGKVADFYLRKCHWPTQSAASCLGST